MRKYNIANYVRYKKDVEAQIKRVRKPIDGDYTFLTNKEIEINFLPLVATLAHKQSTSDQASGVLSINDLILSRLFNGFKISKSLSVNL